MKRITIDEELYARFKELCNTNECAQTDMLETLMNSYRSASNKELIDRISSLEIELLELRNQLIA